MSAVEKVLVKEFSKLTHPEKVLLGLVKPIMLEFHLRDVLQIIVGATILAIPVGFTEEVWVLGKTLPQANIAALAVVSIGFISTFVYYNYYKGVLARHWLNFAKRILSTYLLSLIVVAGFLTIIQKADWGVVFLVAFPASMSAVITDVIK